MALSIQLNTPREHLWTPGEKISGNVILKIDDDTNIEAVNIKFRGKVDSKVVTSNGQRRQTHTHQAYLFVQQLTLFRGPYTLPAREHSWPFEFIFPSHTDLNLSNAFSDNPNSRFQDGPQALPASVYQHASNSGSSVDYKLKAEIPRTFVDWSAENYLSFMPLRLEADPDPLPRTNSDNTMDKKYRIENDTPRELTKRETLHDMMHGSRDSQMLFFRVQIEAPSVLVIGQPFPVLLKIEINQKLSTPNAIIPPVILRQVRGALKTFTYVRVPGIFSDHTGYADNDISIGGSNSLALPLLLDVPISLSDIWASSIPLGSRTPGGSIVPSFSTYSTMREYWLKFHVTISVLDKLFEAKVKIPKVMVLSPFLETPTRIPMQMPVEAPMQAPPRFELESPVNTYPDPNSGETGPVAELPTYANSGAGAGGPAVPPPSYGDEKIHS